MQVTFFFLTCLLTSGIISISQAIQCRGSAKYKLTFKGQWTKADHPQGFPEGRGPHFSAVVGCSHNTAYIMWRPGELATKGVKDVAELGRNREMNKEIDEQINLKRAINKFEGADISNVGTDVVKNVEVTTEYPLVSAISMIAPSPDWFLGVRDYNLCNTTTGKWLDKRERSLPLYDSGTDSAVNFIHTGTPTNPPVKIFLITKIPEDSTKNETLQPFGTFTFEKTSELIPSPTLNASPTNQATTKQVTTNQTTTKQATTKQATTTGEASSVQHLGIFVFLKLMIFNTFFTNIIN